MYYVYRFLDENDKVIYVGKTINLKQRINSHFGNFGHLNQECYNKVKSISFIELNSMTECSIYEIYYINKYKPIFNVKDKYSDETIFTIEEKEWKQYCVDFKNIERKTRKNILCLKRYRSEYNYSQNDIAIEIGISDRAYRDLECGKSKPSYDVVLALEDLFQVSHRELFKYEKA